MMSLRDQTLDRTRKTKDKGHKKYYKELKTLTYNALEREKHAYFTFYVNNNKSDSNAMWKHIKRVSPLVSSSTTPSVPHHLLEPNKMDDYFRRSVANTAADEIMVHFYKQHRFSDGVFNILPTTET